MVERTRSETVTFTRPFELRGVDRLLPSGDYRVVTDEELIEGLSFPVYRRIATMIFVPSQSQVSSIEMITIDPTDLHDAQKFDSDASLKLSEPVTSRHFDEVPPGKGLRR
jgi:hypothetical protein